MLLPLRGRQGMYHEMCPKLEAGQMSQGIGGNDVQVRDGSAIGDGSDRLFFEQEEDRVT